uniref:DUF4955 domain-containing protein n=1 Tax=Prevotella sp. GTC17262 TaxID=3236797 RepID=A0AB33JTB7_9BACT
MYHHSLKHKLSIFIGLGMSLTAYAQGDNHYWTEFNADPTNSAILDYSYAGYKRGEKVPPTIAELKAQKYKEYKVTDYGLIPDDDKSDRQAFINLINTIGNKKTKAKAIIYFPEGRYILHDDDDNIVKAGVKQSETILINMGYLVIRGDGKDKTFLEMKTPNLPKSEKVMYSSPIMLQIKHNGKGVNTLQVYGQITADSKKGSHSITISDASQVKPGQWVWLRVQNYSDDVIDEELQNCTIENTMTDLKNNGVQVDEYHVVESVNGNVVTFKEPIMHGIKERWGWVLQEYPHYEEVGIEDLTFVGHACNDFVHHRTWKDDGAYKPLSLMRLTDSWVRRVGFQSVSEALTFETCANTSAYEIEFSGNRGHSAVRAANSTRAFIGNVYDHSDGYYVEQDYKTRYDGLGQYHACGVSKHSIGCVIWNCDWGLDACFESHATQPRATLIDVCTGGFMPRRMGGDRNQLPNHLDDLVIWNFNSKPTQTKAFGTYNWWNSGNVWVKVMPPMVVGFHGHLINFATNQMKCNESYGTAVNPKSLYLAQLERRLGKKNEWMQQITTGIESPQIFRPAEGLDKGIYTLKGEKLDMDIDQLPQGFYIIDGKKVRIN